MQTMIEYNRRAFLERLGAVGVVGSLGAAGVSSGRVPVFDQEIEKLGHSVLSDPPGGFADADISPDGQYGVVGSYIGEGGTFLVDLSDPAQPSEVHRIPSQERTRNNDVKFDPRGGIYYRTQEAQAPGGNSGIEVVDYGFSDEHSPEDPAVVATFGVGDTHNVSVHGTEPVLYTTNDDAANDVPGVDVIDVSEPSTPALVNQAGPVGDLHDIDYDAKRNLLHAAYIDASDPFGGYAILDVSDPWNPSFVGGFDYEDATDYDDVDDGQPGNYELGEGFENCHYATAEPYRGLAYVGDEKGTNVPGGKHVFDIGYDVGSLEEPVPVGFVNSPRAELQEGPNEIFDWTTHNHSVICRDYGTFLIGGDYRDGAVLYDVTEPHNPVPIDQYLTDDGWDPNDDELPNTGYPILPVGRPPMAWTAEYHEDRDLIFVSDMVTGVYTFRMRDGQ